METIERSSTENIDKVMVKVVSQLNDLKNTMTKHQDHLVKEIGEKFNKLNEKIDAMEASRK